jgi:regulator of sigma E protease
MSDFFGGLFWFIVTLGVLVTFHEYGHFLVARLCGVKVVRFSVGFGRALWSRTATDGTVYQIAMLPLGGYVKMLDERDDEVAPIDRDRAFNRQHVLKRIAIVAAGPAANLLLCIALIWGAFVLGVPDLKPVIGKTDGLAAAAGLHDGDTITALDGQATGSWPDAIFPLFLAAVDHRPLVVDVLDERNQSRRVTLPLDRLAADFDQTKLFEEIGLNPLGSQNRPVVGEVAPGAAARGILMPGDEILALNGHPVPGFLEMIAILQKQTPQGQAVEVTYRRGNEVARVKITPRLGENQGKPVWQLGLKPLVRAVIRQHGPVDALGEAVSWTGDRAHETFAVLGRLLTGKASTKTLSGSIGIAQAAHMEANNGPSRLLQFMAVLSLTLCIINLLPIPVLDGGHLLYYLIELVSGRPVSESVVAVGQVAGLVVLAGLIVLTNFNDLLRIF